MIYRKLLCAWSSLLFLIINVNAEVITKDSAAIMAMRFMESMGHHNKKLVPFNFCHDKTTSRVPSIDSPAYYMFHGANNEGFVIVSADDVAKPILGYSFNHVMEDSIGNFPPAMKDWLNEMENQILYARKHGVKQSAEVAEEWTAPKYGSIMVQLKTAQWNQDAPFNQQCPLERGQRCVTGCVPTAYAILMKYYGYPTSGRGKTQGYICEESGVYVAPRNLEHNYQWNMMPLEYNRGQYSQQQANCVSQLMADIGAAIQADYSAEGTAASYGSSAVFAHFGYNPGTRKIREEYSARNWYSMLCAELDMNRPVLYRGASSLDEGGHAFIIDGYTNQNTFCINWGWGGHYNGTFALDALTPGGSDYRSGQEAYVDCVPASELPSVAKVGKNIECPSLKTAISIAPRNGELTQITMLQNTNINYEKVYENQNILLDLNGFTVNIEEYGIYNYGSLRIMDSKSTGKISLKNASNTAIVLNYKSLIIEGGEFYYSAGFNADENAYCRCVWTEEGSTTNIKGGQFISSDRVLSFNGEATIEGGQYKCTGNDAVVSNYNTTGKLIINGGSFENTLSKVSGNDYRRCVWTSEGTNTIIDGGEYVSSNQVLCFNGDATIKKGNFKCTGNDAVVSNYNTTGKLIINGGSFENTLSKVSGNDYRRCVWTSEGTNTIIDGGEFVSSDQVICFNGDATIENGDFECTGNNGVISNYNTAGILTINGGFFENTSTGIVEKDYRRSVWTAAGTTTHINGGHFTNKSDTQTLCFNGEAVITNGVIENKGRGTGCISNGNVKITGCMLCADRILYTLDGANLKCSGGFYSQKVEDEYLEQGYKCVPNNGLNSSKYPFRVNNETGIEDIENDGVINNAYYDLNGKKHSKTHRGVNIVRKSNGKSVKILYK